MKPKIYDAGEHKIAPDKIDTHAFYVIEKLRQAGHAAYLVGGGVRDLLLNQRPKDFDVSTSAKPEEIKALFRNAILIGRRFRLAHIRFGKKIIEVSTFRSGRTQEADLILRDNEWGSEEEDVLRRDFTINGLLYDPQTEKVIDYVDGYPDIEKRVLRAIGEPEVRFIQDPVRMIRLIKFSARFGFEIHPPTFEALLACKKEILKSSSARVFEELLRMLESGASRSFFHLLNEYGLLKALLPGLSRFLTEKDNLTLKLLEVVDDEIYKTKKEFDRALLLTSLAFPIFETKLEELKEKKTPHLGQITDFAYRIIDEVFSPFFKLPRRMKAVMSFILSTQYRFIPLDGKKIRKPKAPKDSSFPLALELLKYRATINPDLLSHYTLWSEAAFSFNFDKAPAKRRRKRRRRKQDDPQV